VSAFDDYLERSFWIRRRGMKTERTRKGNPRRNRSAFAPISLFRCRSRTPFCASRISVARPIRARPSPTGDLSTGLRAKGGFGGKGQIVDLHPLVDALEPGGLEAKADPHRDAGDLKAAVPGPERPGLPRLLGHRAQIPRSCTAS